MVVCVHIPRFALSVAVGGAEAQAGRALALAPMAGGELRVGEVSGAAEAYGVTVGMAMEEALARCPDLELVPADPLAVAEAWEGVLDALEGIGAAVEPAQGAIAYFDAEGLRGMHGSDSHTIAAARRALSKPVRIGAAPTRFCALAAALTTSTRRASILDAREASRRLAAAPVELLGHREETAMLVEPLKRLGVRTLGELREMGPNLRDALSDRFGRPGVIAYGLANGEDSPLTPRRVEDTLAESLQVGDASSGTMLRRVMGVLVDRLFARPERRGRTLRAVVLSAHLEGGGTWRERVVFREALSDPKRVCLSLSLRLSSLPAPAEVLRLEAERFGPACGEQHTLLDQTTQARHERLREAVNQVRTVGGNDAALRVVCIDPDSRVPERRVVLTPLPG
jgi:nucleotidyltransferase/DNA polymerase involved in DNA repair